MVHANVPKFEVLVEGRYLNNLAAGNYPLWEKGTVVALSCYEGHFPTFEVLMDNGALFSYLPVVCLSNPKKLYDPLAWTIEEASHCRSIPSRIEVHKLDVDPSVSVWLKSKEIWMDGEYLFTVDWIDGNQNLNFVSLSNGQYAFVPNYRMLFGKGKRELPPYKKLKQEWK